MKKFNSILYSFLSIVLVVSMVGLFASCVSDISENLITDTSDTSYPSDTSDSVEPTPDTEYVEGEKDLNDEYALKLGEGTINRIVCSNDGSMTKFGFRVKGLEEKSYEIHWDINKDFLSKTRADFIYDEVYDDVIGQMKTQICFLIDKGGTHDSFWAYEVDDINSLFEKTVYASLSEEFTIWFFEAPYISAERDNALCTELYTYFNSLHFTETEFFG